MSYKKSNVTGRTWSTPFNTPFFFRWGDWSVKVPMENLREEYDAWEELQRRPRPEGKPGEQGVGETETGTLPSFSPNAFDWAEDVEQELFSDDSDSDNLAINVDGMSDSESDRMDFPSVDPTVPADNAVAGPGADDDDEEVAVAPEKDEAAAGAAAAAAAADLTPPTPTAHIGDAVYRIIKVSRTNNVLSIGMVEDGRPIATSPGGSTTAQTASEVIQFLAGVGLLKLDTYETIFEAAARGCAFGEPFWLRDPSLGYEIVV